MPEHTPAPTPSRSLYGFFLYLFSKTVLAVYCAWAFLPESYLHILNIYYFPEKHWATAVPIQCLVGLTLFAFIIYPSSNLMLTPVINSLNTIQDAHSHSETEKLGMVNADSPSECICRNSNTCYKLKYKSQPEEIHENAVPPLHDLNIRDVCRKLYLNNK